MNTIKSPFPVPAQEIHSRVCKIQKAMRDQDLDAILIVQRADLFYFSGTAQCGYLFIPAEDDPLLMIRRHLPRAQEESAIAHIVPINSTKEMPAVIAERCGALPARLGLELDVMPVNEFRYFRGLFGCESYHDAAPIILATRMIKSDWEIARMEEAAALSHRCFLYVAEHLRPGIPEIVFAGMVETHAREHGHGGKLRVRDYQTEGYPWHILSGPNGGMLGLLDSPMSGAGTSPAFPCGAGHRKIQSNEPIMVDFGSVLNGYHFDETRMFALGRMPRESHDACQAAIEIHNHVLDAVRPGLSVDALYRLAVQKAGDLGRAGQFLGPQGHKVQFIGHGIGVELIEPPIIARGRQDVLQEGMLFALEPKLNVHTRYAAGIESVVLVTATGHRLISQVPVKVFLLPG